MNTSEAAAVIASLAAAVSAGATSWYGLLTLRMVRTTNTSLELVKQQTEEVLRTRLDARAPRVTVRSVIVDDLPSLAIGTDGRGLRRVTEAVLPLDGPNADRQLVVTVRISLSNEGDITAHITLPPSATIERAGGGTVVLPPGDQVETQFRVSAPLHAWADAAAAHRPIEMTARFLVDDSFQDGVTDRLELVVRAYAVAPGDDADEVSIEPERRTALGLVSAIEVRPIVRAYRMLASTSPASPEKKT